MSIPEQIAEIKENVKHVLCPEMLFFINRKYRELKELELEINNNI